jgi:hypothetical protein
LGTANEEFDINNMLQHNNSDRNNESLFMEISLIFISNILAQKLAVDSVTKPDS